MQAEIKSGFRQYTIEYMAKRREIRNSTAEFLIFQIEGKEQGVEVYYKDKTVWCTQKAMGMLFDCDRSVVSKHLGNIFKSGELVESAVCAKIAHTASDGKTYQTQFYNLDAVISVGYRVNSIRAKGDQALFGGLTTEQMKKRLGIKSGALADRLPTLTIAAKNFATEMTNYNVEQKDLYGEMDITAEHVQNNRSVRGMLGQRGIRPESLPPAEDIKKVEPFRLASAEPNLFELCRA